MSEKDWRLLTLDHNNRHQREELINLLGEAFGRKYRPYYELQLETVANAESTYLIGTKDKTLIGHIQVVPYDIYLPEKKTPHPCAYLYAICTLKSEQEKGVMTHLLEHVIQSLPSQGYSGALLLPAEQNLVKYYERFGFSVHNKSIFTRIPPHIRPSIRPSEIAKDFLQKAAELDAQFEPEAHQDRHAEKKSPYIPLPSSAGWMWHPLSSGLTPPAATLLLNPMT